MSRRLHKKPKSTSCKLWVQNISKINSITLRGCVWAFPVTQIFQTRLKLENQSAAAALNSNTEEVSASTSHRFWTNSSFCWGGKNVNFWYLSSNFLHDSQHYFNEGDRTWKHQRRALWTRLGALGITQTASRHFLKSNKNKMAPQGITIGIASQHMLWTADNALYKHMPMLAKHG